MTYGFAPHVFNTWTLLAWQVASAPACRHFRLTISRVRDVAAASAVHLACLDLHHVPSGV